MNINLSAEEIDALYDLLSKMNYYETAAILCKTHPNEQMINDVSSALFIVARKLEVAKGEKEE
jgi:hypothetical protein